MSIERNHRVYVWLHGSQTLLCEASESDAVALVAALENCGLRAEAVGEGQ